MYQTIVVLLDGTPLGEQALPLACAIVQQCDAMLYCLHVNMPLTSLGMPVGLAAPEGYRSAATQRYLLDVCDRIAVQYRIRQVDNTSVYTPGLRAILTFLINVRADLLVLVQPGPLYEAGIWFTTLTNAVIHTSPVPLLIIPQQPLDGESVVHPASASWYPSMARSRRIGLCRILHGSEHSCRPVMT